MSSLSSILALCIIPLAYGATVTYDFKVSWVFANPDGGLVRPVMGINGQWPLPPITATVGDRVIVNVQNQLGNQTTSLHFHGLYMNGTNQMDGPVGVTQCGIAPGENFTYDFTIKQPGTYWYHSHVSAQYPDGLRGPLIISDPDSPYKGQYDEERYLTLSEWYYDQMADLLKTFINVENPKGAEPIPNAALMNDTQNLTSLVEPGKTYMFRIINMAAFAAQYLWFEGHTMQIVEVDGIYTEAAETDMIYLTAAQRYSVLIKTKNDSSTNYAFVGSMDTDLFDKVPDTLNTNVTGYLIYNNNTADLPTPALLDSFEPFDDFTLVPKDAEPLLPKPDYSFPLTVVMNNLGDGANYAFFNNITYVPPKVPTLYTALTTGATATNPYIYGPNTNAFVLKRNDIIEIVVNNNDTGKHPFHLHGHAFQAIARSDDAGGNYVGNETFPATPMRRDTFMVRPQGNIVIRFRADNPDKFPPSSIWLFHCHIEWHIASGLVATMVESPESLQVPGALSLPTDHLDACNKQNIPIAGNAAGNTVDLFDMTGANVSVPPLPDGFTARGIVALVFSCVAGLVGIAVISWYGAGEIGEKAKMDIAGAITVEGKEEREL